MYKLVYAFSLHSTTTVALVKEIFPSIKIHYQNQRHEIIDPRFFHQTIPTRALIHGLKPFRIWLRIRRENRNNRLQSSDSAVSIAPRDPL
jgi:hypothetical protein